jgi:hypothetical protein
MNAMKLVALTAAVVAAAATWTAGAQSKPSGHARVRSVFVSVTDRGGPVLTLGPADFEITEHGAIRPVIRASLATSPMRVALLIDTSDGAATALNAIRTGLAEFLTALPPQHEVLLVSTGRQVRIRVPPTTDRRKLNDAAKGLFPDGGATPLMDALLEVDDRFMRKADERWPVFVIVTADGAEGSAGANEKKFNDWVRALPARGVAAHGVSLTFKGGGMPEVVASHVVQTAGGLYDFMNTSNGLPAKLAAIGERMARDFETIQTKYEIAFETDAADAGPVSIGVKREGVTLQMSNGRLR